MPPLPSPGNIVRVELVVTDNASINAGSRFFLSYSGSAPSAGDLNTMATDVANAYGSDITPYLRSGEELVSVVCTDLSSSTGAQGTWNGSKGGGDTSGAVLPASAAVVVNHTISRRYRGGKPKTFMRMGTTNDLSGTNQWVSGSITNFKAAWQAFINAVLAITGIGITLDNIVNVSYYEGFTAFETPSGRYRNIPKVRTTPLVDDITDATIAVKVGSQRRRLNV